MVVCWPFYQSGAVPRHDLAHLEDLALNRHDLAHLEEPFLEEEVPAVIRDIAGEKAPGPDGFIGVFLKRSWLVIKEDLMSAFYFFYQHHGQHFQHLNSAHLVLLPKKPEPKK
jgi:hypothetical protein